MFDKELEEAKEVARQKVLVASSLERLLSNSDFKSLITDGLFKEEAARLVEHSFNINLRDNWGLIQQEIQSISYLHNYLKKVAYEGKAAKEALAESVFDNQYYGEE